jgi:DNA polymerase-3 subunit epsilon
MPDFKIPELGVFDTETTGTDTEECRIVTAFIGMMDPTTGNLGETFSWLINPGVDIPEGASDVHGISNEVAQRDGMDPKVAIAEIVAVLTRLIDQGTPITAYNARFDLTLTDREYRRHHGKPFLENTDRITVIDPYVIDKQVDKYRKGPRKLVTTAANYGITFDGAHEAEADATATGRLALEVMKKDGIPSTLQGLHDIQVVWAFQQAAGLQAHFRKTKNDETITIEGIWPIAPFGERVTDERGRRDRLI